MSRGPKSSRCCVPPLPLNEYHDQPPALSSNVRSGVDARFGRSRTGLLWLVSRSSALVLNLYDISAKPSINTLLEESKTYADVLDARSFDVGEGSRVAEVGVDASERLSVGSADVVEDDMSLGADFAVAACAVELAETLDGEAADGHGACSVVLEDFVFLFIESVVQSPFVGSWLTAPKAPPPIILVVSPASCSLIVKASSQTADHQTLVKVQAPKQCTPSTWLGPMITLESEPPSSISKTASLLPPSA